MKKVALLVVVAMTMMSYSSNDNEFASVGQPLDLNVYSLEAPSKTSSTSFETQANQLSSRMGKPAQRSECSYPIQYIWAKDGKKGCAIDEKIAVPAIFSTVQMFSCENSLFAVKKNDKLGVVKAFGKDYIVPCEFSQIDVDDDRRLLYLRKAGEDYETYSLDTGKKWEGTEIWPPKSFPVEFQLKDLTEFPHWKIESFTCKRVGGLNTLGRRGANNGFEFRVKGIGIQNWNWQGPGIRASFIYIEMNFEKEDGSLKKFSDNTAFPSVSEGKPFEIAFFAADSQLKDINPAGIVLKSIHHNPSIAIYGSTTGTATHTTTPTPQEKVVTPEKVNIPKKTLTADYNSLLKQPRITASERTALKIDEVNDDDLVDISLNKYENSNLVKGEVVYQNKTGKLLTVHVIAEDHAAQTHLLSYDASGNYIDHILVSYHFIYRGDNRKAVIQVDKISMTDEWGECEEDCTFNFEGGITPELKFVKKYLNQTNESSTETNTAPATGTGTVTGAAASVSIEDNPAMLHLYRKRKVLDFILPTKYDILLDNKAVGNSTNNWKTTVKVTTSGTKTVSATIDGRKATVLINFEPGGLYYVRSDVDSKEVDTGKTKTTTDRNGKTTTTKVTDFEYTPILQLVDNSTGESEFNKIK